MMGRKWKMYVFGFKYGVIVGIKFQGSFCKGVKLVDGMFGVIPTKLSQT